MTEVVFISSKVCNGQHFESCDELISSIISHIDKIADELNKSKSAYSFINKCKELGKYLIKNKIDCNQCYRHNYGSSPNIDEVVNIFLKNVTKFGGCPHPITSKDEERIKLISEVEEFCEEKKGHIKKIKLLRDNNNAQKEFSTSETYKSECSTYLEWLGKKKEYFLGKEEQITTFYKKKSLQIQFPLNCDVTNADTFKNKDDICGHDKSEESELYKLFLDGQVVDDSIDEYIGNSIHSESPGYKYYYELPELTVTGASIPETFLGTLPHQKQLPPQEQFPYRENLTLEEDPPVGLFHNEHQLFSSLPEFRSSPKENKIFVQMVEPAKPAELAKPPPNRVSGYKLFWLILIIISGVLSSLALLLKNTPIGLYLSRNKRKKRKEINEKITRVLLGLQSPAEASNSNVTYGGFSS